MDTDDDRHYWRYTLNRQCPTGRVLVFSIYPSRCPIYYLPTSYPVVTKPGPRRKSPGHRTVAAKLRNGCPAQGEKSPLATLPDGPVPVTCYPCIPEPF